MERPLFVFAPGAGAPSSNAWIKHWCELLSTLGAVSSFDYGYMSAAVGRPSPLPQLIANHRVAIAEARKTNAAPVVLIGKSMGSRIGCHVALEEKVAALICLGYPLCGGGDPSKLRDKVLKQLKTPILFVQGTRDRLCPLGLLEQVRSRMAAPNELHVVEDGDHSLLAAKRQLRSAGETQDDVDRRILDAIGRFVAEHVSSVS